MFFGFKGPSRRTQQHRFLRADSGRSTTGGNRSNSLLPKLLPLFAKAFKSWIFGITSALIVWWGVSFCVFFSRNSLFLIQQLRKPTLEPHAAAPFSSWLLAPGRPSQATSEVSDPISDSQVRLRRATLLLKNGDTVAASKQFFKLETRMCDSYDPKAA